MKSSSCSIPAVSLRHSPDNVVSLSWHHPENVSWMDFYFQSDSFLYSLLYPGSSSVGRKVIYHSLD